MEQKIIYNKYSIYNNIFFFFSSVKTKEEKIYQKILNLEKYIDNKKFEDFNDTAVEKEIIKKCKNIYSILI